MGSEIELVSDGEGLAIIGSASDVERFFPNSGLDHAPSREIDLHNVWAASGTVGAAAQVGADIAANSGRWVKLTAESAEAVRKYGLMATKTPGVSHVMIGQPGDIKQWLQIAQTPSMLLSGPLALTTLSTMMQQRAMQQQMDEMVEYLKLINEKVDDILRGQKDAVLADMIGVDLTIEDALTVRDEVGRVSEVTWSKVQATSQTIARTQACALRELDGIAEKLKKKAAAGDIAHATREAETKVREWLAVLARTFQLQEGLSVLELDRVLNAAPEDIESHRLGLAKARQSRLERIERSTAALLTQMDDTVRRANARVLLNPFDSPAAVMASNQVGAEAYSLRSRLGLEDANAAADARRWGQAAGEIFEKARSSAADGAGAAKRLSEQAFDRAAGVVRPAVMDDDKISDQPRAAAAAEQAGVAIRGAAAGVAGAVGGLFQRKRGTATQIADSDSDSAGRADP